MCEDQIEKTTDLVEDYYQRKTTRESYFLIQFKKKKQKILQMTGVSMTKLLR